MYVGSLAGSRTYYFTGAGDHLLLGPILNSTNGAPIALAKSGAGTLTLGGTNTYANGTTLSGGTMLVNGSLPAGTFTISSGTTLGGDGVINSAVVLPAGATLAPGVGVGRLTVNNSVTLSAGSTTRIELDKAAGTNAQLRVVGSLAYGGTLSVTNLGGALWTGDAFRIFDAASVTGVFAATNLPPLPASFNWQWSPANGTLSITSTVALDPADVTVTFAGHALQLAWPADHIGWHLETNAADLADPDSWFILPGSATTNQVFIDVGPANVFFRLTFP